MDFKTGFARVDITPPLGTTMEGYFHRRVSDGILDPLLASALAVSDGERLAFVLSIDIIGINQIIAKEIRRYIAERTGTVAEAVFLCCTHTHLAPALNGRSPFDECAENEKYKSWLLQKLGDAAVLATGDLKETEVFTAKGTVSGVTFVRNFRMRDGSVATNPGFLNPDIVKPLFEADETLSLVVFKRRGGKEIAIINFQVHADMVGGTKFSADYPKFVRDTYEKVIDNSFCMFITGAQGDTNHIDVTLGEDKLRCGYERSRYSGRAIACEAIKIYPMAEKVAPGEVKYIQKRVFVPYNTATPEEIQEAKRVYKLWLEGRDEEICKKTGMSRTSIIAKAWRIITNLDKGPEKELHLTALSFGDVALSCFPGEPYGDVGRGVRNGSGFKATLIACCANGYEGYFPMRLAYEGGYESSSSAYQAGTAERLTEEALGILEDLK